MGDGGPLSRAQIGINSKMSVGSHEQSFGYHKRLRSGFWLEWQLCSCFQDHRNVYVGAFNIIGFVCEEWIFGLPSEELSHRIRHCVEILITCVVLDDRFSHLGSAALGL